MHASSLVLLASSLFAGAVTAATNHQIVVGGAAGLVFTPSNITAEVGDTVTFIYQAKNHSVTQSGFAAPCTLLQNATTGATGFDSGYVPVAANATENPAWTLQVTVATPIWFYCKQGNHCQSGMVGSINAAVTGNKTFADFKALAMTQTTTGSGASSVVSSGVGAVATGSLTSVPASEASAAASSTSSSSSSSTTKAGAASTVKRSTAALLTAVALAYFTF
ncbi:Cupredoxin [Meredithblackwellia eburnea MCA 4105]